MGSRKRELGFGSFGLLKTATDEGHHRLVEGQLQLTTAADRQWTVIVGDVHRTALVELQTEAAGHQLLVGRILIADFLTTILHRRHQLSDGQRDGVQGRRLWVADPNEEGPVEAGKEEVHLVRGSGFRREVLLQVDRLLEDLYVFRGEGVIATSAITGDNITRSVHILALKDEKDYFK